MHDIFISDIINETISIIEVHVPSLLQWIRDSLYTKENIDQMYIKILTPNDHKILKTFNFHPKPQFVLYSPFKGNTHGSRSTYISCNKHAFNNSSIMTFKMFCKYDKKKYKNDLIFCDMMYNNIDGKRRLNINTFTEPNNAMSIIHEVFVMDIVKKMWLLSMIVNNFKVNYRKKKKIRICILRSLLMTKYIF